MILLLRRVKSIYYENERDRDEFDENHSFYVYCILQSYGCLNTEKIQFKMPHEILLHS